MQKNDTYYMRLAIQQAEVASSNNEVPVGALLVMQDDRVFAAHNASISLNDASAHAEMNVIRAACKAVENYRLINSTLYVTLEPCVMCAGAILHARIARVVYGTRDTKSGAVESLYQILSDSRLNHQPEILGGIMHKECSVILRDFFRLRR